MIIPELSWETEKAEGIAIFFFHVFAINPSPNLLRNFTQKVPILHNLFPIFLFSTSYILLSKQYYIINIIVLHLSFMSLQQTWKLKKLSVVPASIT